MKDKKEQTEEKPTTEGKPKIFALRTTANREDQVMDFVSSNAEKKKYKVYSIIRPHGMRGYIFVEAASKQDAEQAAKQIEKSNPFTGFDVSKESKKILWNGLSSGAAFRFTRFRVHHKYRIYSLTASISM